MIKSLRIEDLVDRTPGMLKVRLYVYLSRKYMYKKIDPVAMTEDAMKVFQDDGVIPLIEEWMNEQKA